MRTFYAATVLEENGKLNLDHLPFAKGEVVQVFLSTTKPFEGARYPLRGTVLKYENATSSVA